MAALEAVVAGVGLDTAGLHAAEAGAVLLLYGCLGYEWSKADWRLVRF